MPTITVKCATPFGSHVYRTLDGELTGGAISHPWKNPDAQVDQLIRALSAALDEALRS